jgi:hypothetical protein
MKRLHRCWLAAAVGLLPSPGALAQSSEPRGFNFYLDNDVLLLDPSGNEDRNYTMGMSFQWSGSWLSDSWLSAPLRKVNGWPGFRALRGTMGTPRFTEHSFEFGNVAFTPDRLEIPTPILDDRPYASLLFVDIAEQVVHNDLRRAFTSELSMGILGLRISESVQTWIHEGMQDFPGDTPYTPRGWPHQISDGGEGTARYVARWQGAAVCRRNIDLQWLSEASLGYHTNLGGGVVARAGRISSPWWRFTAVPISQGVGIVPNASDGGAPCAHVPEVGASWEAFVWAAGSARLWGYNVFLQGQGRDNPVEVPNSRLERVVGDYSTGAVGGFRWPSTNIWLSARYTYTRRSPELDGPERRYHDWGGIYVSITRVFAP